MEVVCILNPAAGRGSAPRKWKQVMGNLAGREFKIETLTTTGPGDAARLAKQVIAQGARIIIAAGGDGTVNEVAGAAAGSDVKVALAPFGTGNDLARGLSIPRRTSDWADSFPSFAVRKLDLGLVNGKYFINQAGFGFDARVGHKVNTGIGFLTGKPAYLAAVASCLRDLSPVETELLVDGVTIHQKVILAAFANNVFIGGGLKLAPSAIPDDGLLDLIVIGDISRLELLKSFPMLFSGSHIKHPAVSMWRGKTFSLNSDRREYGHIDGEIYETDLLEINIKPGCLNFLVPF
ncbi:diacylglycerol/lipid kinase family protein [Phosphitispora sp. TUW77]|uniref:diacylglycerol/lipid kinase family protein n=1 Tax=Phosphitispora sp. TUW77 TaxID=3152361 RepID=UPI003AB5845E